MYRRLLIPAIAVTALAQQTSPASAEAEKALRARAEQFYQFEVDKHFRQIEDTLVAEDSKDYFYNSNRPNIKSFSVTSVEITDGGTRAKVTARIAYDVMFPGIGLQPIDLPTVTKWKLENGQWSWYVMPEEPVATPFGLMTPKPASAERGKLDAFRSVPDIRALEALVSISSQTVALTEDEPVRTVTISNAMAGAIDFELSPGKIEGVTVEAEKSRINAGEAATLRFRLTGKAKASGVVRVTCSPLGQVFNIRVSAN